MNRQLVLLDSIALVDETAAGHVIVSGSHGGSSAARFVLDLKAFPLVVFYNDAGVGKANAGIVGLDMLGSAGVACATYSHTSACIGDARDGLENGVVSHTNSLAAILGVSPGAKVSDVAKALCREIDSV
jgi:hypothetical protein